MATITLYPHHYDQIVHNHATKVDYEGGMLTFVVGEDAGKLTAKRIRTTLPFLVEEEVDTTHGW